MTKNSITLSIREWGKLVRSHRAYDEALSESLDEIESEEEFLAKPSLIDDGSCPKILIAKIERINEEDNWYEELLLFDENKKLVKEIPIFSHSQGWRDAESQAKDFAYSIHSEIDWTQC